MKRYGTPTTYCTPALFSTYPTPMKRPTSRRISNSNALPVSKLAMPCMPLSSYADSKAVLPMTRRTCGTDHELPASSSFLSVALIRRLSGGHSGILHKKHG